MKTAALRHFSPPPRQHTEQGAVICAGYHPPRIRENARAVTCRGIVIGGAIGPVLPTMTQDGELIQAALLDPRTARRPAALRRLGVLAVNWGWAVVLVAVMALSGCQSDIDTYAAMQADLADAVATAAKEGIHE